MMRRTLLTGLLPGLLLGAAPLASWAQQQPEDRLHDSTFVQRHRIRTVTELRSAQYEPPQQLTEQTTKHFSPTGRVLRVDDPHEGDPTYEARGPNREEVQVEDAQGRTVAIEHYTDELLESVEYWIYGPQNKVIQSFVHETGTGVYNQPERWYAQQTTHYDLLGNAVESVQNGAYVLGKGQLLFGPRSRSSYDYAGRCIATVEYEQLIYPKQTDSTYYNAQGQVTRRVRYDYQQGRPYLKDLAVQQYDAAGRLRTCLSGENSGSWQRIMLLRYRPDGQPAASVEYSGRRLPVGPAPQYLPDTLRLVREARQEHHIYRYNEQGLLEEISRYNYFGNRPINEAYDLKWREAWRYTYYP